MIQCIRRSASHHQLPNFRMPIRPHDQQIRAGLAGIVNDDFARIPVPHDTLIRVVVSTQIRIHFLAQTRGLRITHDQNVARIAPVRDNVNRRLQGPLRMLRTIVRDNKSLRAQLAGTRDQHRLGSAPRNRRGRRTDQAVQPLAMLTGTMFGPPLAGEIGLREALLVTAALLLGSGLALARWG